MSDVTHETKPATKGDDKKKDSSEATSAGERWMPKWLRGAGFDKQEEARKPGNQPGFDEQEAANQFPGVKGKDKAAAPSKEETEQSKDASPERPAGLKFSSLTQIDGNHITIMVKPGAMKGVKKGEVVSWGHVAGVVTRADDFVATVDINEPGGDKLVKDLLSGYGPILNFGPPQQAAPGAEKEDEAASGGDAKTEAPVAAAKKPKIVARPGTPRVKRFSAGRDAKAEIANVKLNVYFGLSGQKLENAAVEYSGSFDNEDIVREVLESLKRVASADLRMQDLTEDDLRPHAEKIARVIRGAK